VTRALALLVAVACAGCGPGGDDAPAFPIELYVSAGLVADIRGFQVSLVKSGSQLDCVTAQRSCIKDQVDAARFVVMKDPAGRDVRSRFFDINLVTGSPNTQDVSLTGLPLGKDFALLVEAVGRDTPPTLRGSACNYVKELTAGSNAAVFAKIEVLTPPASCDPTIP
jgi:hypothetical protein